MLNCAVIMGRLTATPELKTTLKGISVTTFTVAVNRSFGRETDFINVVAWRNTAEFITRYFEKGSMIAITGSIQTRKYEDGNGNKRTAFEVVANNVSFCGSKSESKFNAEMQELASAGPEYISTAGPNDFDEILDDDDDLPF